MNLGDEDFSSPTYIDLQFIEFLYFGELDKLLVVPIDSLIPTYVILLLFFLIIES